MTLAKYTRAKTRPPCSVEGCTRKHNAKGLCAVHYQLERDKDPILYEQRKLAQKARYVANRAKISSKAKREYKKDPTPARLRTREWYWANAERVKADRREIGRAHV